MTELNYQVESLDAVDETLRPLYAEAEGGAGFVLKVAGVVPKNQYDELSQKALDATTEAKRRRQTVERVTGKLGIDSADKLDEAIDALMSGKGKASADQQAIIDQIKADADRKVSEVSGRLKNVMVKAASTEMKAAVLGVGFHPEIADEIAQVAMNRVQLDDDGELRIMKADNTGPLAGSGPGGLATLADLAKELAAAKPAFLVDKGKGGGGKPPASGGNAGNNSKFGNLASTIPGFSQLPEN
jgi:hypothetical protein